MKETHTEAGVEEIMDSVKSYARQYYVTAEENDSEENLKRKEEEIRKALHHQLQKARHDWLWEEIVRLDGMKRDCCAGIGPCNEICRATNEGNHVIQTIIDRYQKELDQDTKAPYTQACGHSVDYIVYAIHGNEKGYCRACREDISK